MELPHALEDFLNPPIVSIMTGSHFARQIRHFAGVTGYAAP